MSVLKGEGKVPILFGSASIAVATRTHRGYLARPDLAGEWPTIVVLPSSYGVTSNVKDVCRRLAREGFAVVAPDVFRGAAPPRSTPPDEARSAAAALSLDRVRRDVTDIVSFIGNPAGFWSSAERGFGVLGLGAAGDAAVRAAVECGATCLGLVTTRLDDTAMTLLGSYAGSVLGLFGREDGVADADHVAALRDQAPHGEFVIYGGVGFDFLDDSGDPYDFGVARDAIDRLAGFYEKHLPPAP